MDVHSMHQLLVVEDDAMNRDMLVRMLTLGGYKVIAAKNGQEAIDLAISEQPELILMDLSIPIIDGWEATRRVKAHPLTHTIPIIALTAHAMPEHRQLSLDAGCDGYETKPIEYYYLLEKISLLLDRA